MPAKRRGVAPTRAASAFFAIPRSAGPQTIRLPHLTYACAIESRSKDADFLTLLPASVVQRTVLAESGLIRNSKALTTHEILGLAIQIHGGLRIADCGLRLMMRDADAGEEKDDGTCWNPASCQRLHHHRKTCWERIE